MYTHFLIANTRIRNATRTEKRHVFLILAYAIAPLILAAVSLTSARSPSGLSQWAPHPVLGERSSPRGGRGGRTGQPTRSILLYGPADARALHTGGASAARESSCGVARELRVCVGLVDAELAQLVAWPLARGVRVEIAEERDDVPAILGSCNIREIPY